VPGKLEMALEPGAPPGLPGELSRKLEIWTGRRWIVTVARAGGEMTLAARRKADADTALKQAQALPDVQAYLKAFPGAEVLRVREPEVPQLSDMTTEEGDEESR
jgi:DNA polymerase-3 subunit gamma/tau